MIKICVVDIAGGNTPSGIDDGVVAFVGCDLKVEDVVDG
jgi:hypothetical protein